MWQVPVPVAEQLHRRRQQHAPDQGRVDKGGDGEPDAELLGDGLFWWSLALSLVIAFVLTVPVNRWLIARGRGHAVMHELHAR